MPIQPAIAEIIVANARKYGQSPAYMLRQAEIESSGNPNAQNPRSSAGGLFQFIDSTAKQYGLGNKFDPDAASDAAARLARDNGNHLRSVLGREPTAGELYLAHQQGAGGAAKILSNPDAPAVSLVGQKAVTLNGGTPDMSGAQYAAKWTSKFNGIGGDAAPALSIPGEAPAASGQFTPSGVQPSATPAPAMVMPAAEPEPSVDTAKLLQTLLGAGQAIAGPAAAPAQAAPRMAPLELPAAAQPFDAARFFAMLPGRRRA